MQAIGKSWRDSASLIVVARRVAESSKVQQSNDVNYDILLQTRTRSASFPNSVVFPGGVSEPADFAEDWLSHFKSFGYTNKDFEAFHYPGSPVTPLFQKNPIQKHISLRITAIRESFEELGLLLCSRSLKKDRSNDFASVISDVDVEDWQKRVSDQPKELLTLCQEYNCYPDIWSLHYWSNWLTPVHQPKRFSTAFFITALPNQLDRLIESKSEVTNVEWINPSDLLRSKDYVIYPPQFYEVRRITEIPDIEKLVKFSKQRSCYGEELLYPVRVNTKDGSVHFLPGDILYPTSVDYCDKAAVTTTHKTAEQLREGCTHIHRFEITNNSTQLVLKNYKSNNHINMGDRIIPANVTVS